LGEGKKKKKKEMIYGMEGGGRKWTCEEFWSRKLLFKKHLVCSNGNDMLRADWGPASHTLVQWDRQGV
jgi:hypothetical protein